MTHPLHPPASLSDGCARAVVLGASLAGLLAARVLSDRLPEVVLLERDALPAGAEARKGTPQAAHPHGLLARGLQVLEELFPGFTPSLVAQGGLLGDLQADVGFDAGRQRYARGSAGQPALAASRLAIEAEVRRRVLARPGVRAVTGVQVLAPRHEQGRVVAARCSRPDGTVEELPAALVIDCTGRGSQAPRWYRDWGYGAPTEERVDIGISYTSAYFRRTGSCALGAGIETVACFGAVTNEQPRPGVALAQEPGPDGVPRWVVGVGGFRGDHPAATLQGMRERAVEIGSPELVRITHDGEPIGEVMRYTMPHSQRRRFERLPRLPEGLLVMGDALASFNPIYGQGMTVAACEALALQDLLRACAPGRTPLARRFFKATARVIDTPWQLAVGGDLSLDCVPGHRPLPVRWVNRYIARIHRVAPHDPTVGLAFQRVVHMLDEPAALFAPRVLWRVLTGRTDRPAPATAGASSMPQPPAVGLGSSV